MENIYLHIEDIPAFEIRGDNYCFLPNHAASLRRRPQTLNT
jgi:hypothetical protein